MSSIPAQKSCVVTFAHYVSDTLPEVLPDDRVALTLQQPWKFGCGLKPDINTAKIPCTLYEKLSQNINRPGRIEMWFNTSPDMDAPADVLLDGVSIVEVRINEVAIPGGSAAREFGLAGTPQATEYEINFADFRMNFVKPRGGRLRIGHINPGPTPPDSADDGSTTDSSDLGPDDTQPIEMSLSDLIATITPLLGIGDVSVPASADMDKIPAPRELKWFGNHAPTELEKLLAGTGLIFCPKSNGTAAIEFVTAQGDPTITGGGQRLPDLTPSLLDRRGTYVVFSSYPTQVSWTETTNGGTAGSADPNNPGAQPPAFDPADYWDFVILDSDGIWRPIQSAKLLRSGGGDQTGTQQPGYVTHIQQNFAKVDPKYRDQLKAQLFRFIRLKSDKWDPNVSPVLATMIEKDQSQNPIQVSATIAIADPTTGLYSNSTAALNVPVVFNAKGNILQLAWPLIQVKGICSDPWLAFNAAAPFAVRYTVPNAKIDDNSGNAAPVFYHCGFQRDGDDFVPLDDATIQNIIVGGTTDALVIPRPELRQVMVDGKSINDQQLQDKAQALAASYLRKPSLAARQIRVQGYAQIEPSGLISEVAWDQETVLTTANVNDWFTTTALTIRHVDLVKLENAGGDGKAAYPAQDTMDATRAANNEPASIAYQAPSSPTPRTPQINTLRMVYIGDPKTCGGIYTGTLYTQLPTFDPTQPSFTVADPTVALPNASPPYTPTTVIVVNLAESGSKFHMIPKGTQVPYIDGLPQADGTPTVIINYRPRVKIKITGTTYTPPTGGSVTLGPGRYGATKRVPPANAPALAGALADGDLGTDGDVVIAFNTREVGNSGHDIDQSDQPLVFLADFHGLNSDGVEIYVFDGIQGGC